MANERFDLETLFAQARETEPAVGLSNVYTDLEVLDQIDGRFVLRPQVRVDVGGETHASAGLQLNEGLTIDITQGRANIEQDPYTGLTLVIPIGSTPVKARPVVEAQSRGTSVALVGEEREIGWDTNNVPAPQLEFAALGGGLCGANFGARFVTPAWQPYDFNLRVRAAMPSHVIPLTPDRREIRWRHALYFAYEPRMGFMRLRYNPEQQSRTVMRSKTSNGSDTAYNFFPAEGENELYFLVELLDLGFRCFNKKSMVQSFDNVEWPPYARPLNIDEPVEFYDVENPDEVMLTINHNEMQIYDYQGVEIERLSYDINPEGLFQSRWRIRSQIEEPVRIRWFALGNFVQDSRFENQGNRLLGPAGTRGDTFEVDFVTQLQKSSLTQFVTMNVVSLDDPLVVGMEELKFKYPQED